jgi:hypothetical protein
MLKEIKKRNVVLKIETYDRLEKYKVKLISKKGDSKLTFDDTINDLLDKTENKLRVEKRHTKI